MCVRPVVHVSHQLTVSAGELPAGETEEFEGLKGMESAELCGRNPAVF